MALDTTPWGIGDPGALHSAAIARVGNYAGTSGGEGIVSSSDCKVQPYATPGTGIRIGPGGWVGLNRQAGSNGQSFTSRVLTDENVSIAATDSGSGRVDLICLIVQDPSVAGMGGTVGGPYHKVLVVSNVPATTQTLQELSGYQFHTGVALARVALPANTSTVTQAMITDLRKMASPRSRQFYMNRKNSFATDASAKDPLNVNSPTFKRWPNVASFDVRIPEWATHVNILGFIESYVVKGGSCTGLLRASFLGLATDHTSFDENTPSSGGASRNGITLGGELAIPAADRGNVRTLNFDGARGGDQAGYLDADRFTNSILVLNFEERIV